MRQFPSAGKAAAAGEGNFFLLLPVSVSLLNIVVEMRKWLSFLSQRERHVQL